MLYLLSDAKFSEPPTGAAAAQSCSPLDAVLKPLDVLSLLIQLLVSLACLLVSRALADPELSQDFTRL